MKNTKLAIFGLFTYIMGVVSSATDLEGNPIAPSMFIIISEVATLSFIAMAAIILWKISKTTSILLTSITITSFILETVQIFTYSQYGNIVLITNFFRLSYAIVRIWAIILLFKTREGEK